MKFTKQLILIIVAAFFTLNVSAQKAYDVFKGNKLYEQLAYSQAIPFFESVLGKEFNAEIQEKLANCYRLTNDPINAESAYLKTVQSSSNMINKLYYAQALQQNGKYEEAKNWYEQYSIIMPSDKRAANGAKACNMYQTMMKDSARYLIKHLPFNSNSAADFGPAYYADKILFASDRLFNSFIKRNYSWTNAPFLNIMTTSKTGENYSTPILFRGKTNTKFHDAVCTFNKNENEMYFTRDNYNEGVIGKSNTDGIVKLKIYFQTKNDEGVWSSPIEFEYNGNDFSTGHPSLSEDGQNIYFASDRPGGFGGTDIYVCKKSINGWSTPQNLGAEINTEGNEMFPYISNSNTLYFASNGKSGLGGLDIFTANNLNNNWSKPENMGYPINTDKDDFGFITNSNGADGYFTSNRKGSDDIYSFVKNCYLLNGLVYDEKTLLPIDAASVKVMDMTIEKEIKTTDANGKFSLCILKDHKYEFIANKTDYNQNQVKLNTENLVSNIPELKIPLTKIEKLAPIGIILKGKVFHESNKMPIENITVKLINFCTGKEITTTTDENGNYSFNLNADCNYRVAVSSTNCGLNYFDKSTMGIKTSQILIQDFSMLCVGDVVKIDNIYYDLDKSYIRPDAAKILDKNAYIFYKYPTMKVELRSHTDCRAPNNYNLALSQRRATSAVNYLVLKGIIASRFVAKGYGETELTNRCADGVKCTEAEHQANRRTEFKILGF